MQCHTPLRKQLYKKRKYGNNNRLTLGRVLYSGIVCREFKQQKKASRENLYFINEMFCITGKIQRCAR